MRISRITQLAFAATVGLSGVSVACLELSRHADEVERRAVQERAEAKQLALDLASASDLLTNEARRYTIFGDRRHFDAYWHEVKETRTRDRVVRRLREMGAPDAELGLIEQAKQRSDALIALEDAAMKAVAAGDLPQAQKLMFGDDYDRSKAEIMAPLAQFQARLVQRTEAAVAAARARAGRMNDAVELSVVLTGLGFLAILWGVLQRRVVTPLLRTKAVVIRLAEQDYDVEIPDVGRRDEIGEMAAAIQVLKEAASARQALEAEQAAEHAARERRAAQVEQLVRAFETAASQSLRTVGAAAARLDRTAQSMSAVADTTAREASTSAAAAGQTSANVHAVAAAAEEMATSLREIAGQVARSTDIAGRAVREAEETDATVIGLTEAAQKIGDVVAMIQGIAGQTNLLALNATIEAARAGEAGKGFAVVAGEVKSLASQTARATEQVTEQIAAMQTVTAKAAQAIRGIGGTIAQMNEITTAIAAAIEEQNAATGEISRNVQQAASGTQGVTDSLAQVTAATGETGTASGEVLAAARELSREAESLSGEVGQFLGQIRQA
jgi:methyl-accepting chemotaxis protein